MIMSPFPASTVMLTIIFAIIMNTVNCHDVHYELRVMTVATDPTDGFDRFNRSANMAGLKVDVLGMGQEWKGGDVRRYPGGGQKMILLRHALEAYKQDDRTVILFTDSYDVILMSGEKEMISLFLQSNSSILISAEEYCWPDASLSESYPPVSYPGKRFLNSGGIIGFANVLYTMITSQSLQSNLSHDDDDQLFLTKIYLDPILRQRYGIKVDSKSSLFQTLNGITGGEVEITFDPLMGHAHVRNTLTKTRPAVIHGNGGSKLHLNSLGNYLAKSWNTVNGCTDCASDEEPTAASLVLIGIFILRPTPFLPSFFHKVHQLDFPKSNISIIIHNDIEYHDHHVKEFMQHPETKGYHSIQILRRHLQAAHSSESVIREADKKTEDDAEANPTARMTESMARKIAIQQCLILSCDYYLSLDSEARITNPLTLQLLMKQNRKVIAPMLTRVGKMWSNFWGSLSTDGFYARSFDYIDIVKNKRRGVWNVPHVSQVYLISGHLIRKGLAGEGIINNDVSETAGSITSQYPSFSSTISPNRDADMSFSESLRREGIFMFVDNLHDYGHLVNPDHYDVSHKNPDLHQIIHNQIDWEEKYLHVQYRSILRPDHEIDQPCPDVYWFPVVNHAFCDELVSTMEHFGKWSSGNNQDDRLSTGYENVPTRDIHMNQVGLEPEWLFFLREYIKPIQEKVFLGYHHDPPKSLMNFVVRYKPDEQPSLRPHHDSSTYTINIALNTPHVDYEGGGCHFHRYNCSVRNMRKGWSLMHPGRLTHLHEGLAVTNGTRYIMISFVDP